MANCVVCNKKIPKGSFFCDQCLEEEIDHRPLSRKLGLLSLIRFSPFAAHFSPKIDIAGQLKVVVENNYNQIRSRWPQIGQTDALKIAYRRARHQFDQLSDAAYQQLQNVISIKRGPERAPWELVVAQPAIAMLSIAMALLIVLWIMVVL